MKKLSMFLAKYFANIRNLWAGVVKLKSMDTTGTKMVTKSSQFYKHLNGKPDLGITNMPRFTPSIGCQWFFFVGNCQEFFLT